MQPQNKGPGMLWGQSYVLPMTWGGGGIWGAPFGRHAALWLFHLKFCIVVQQCTCIKFKIFQIWYFYDQMYPIQTPIIYDYPFNYHISLYSILMAKYLTTLSFPLFSIQLHQHMLILG